MKMKSSNNTYEEARKQRVLDNKKRFEDLGILSLSKNLSDISKSRRKQQQNHHHGRWKQENVHSLEPRRSSRARNPVPSYRDDIGVDDFPRMRKRSKCDSSWASYLARPLEEVKTASFEERADALKSAEKLLSNLQSLNPSFIKSMGLPTRFCEDYLPKSRADIILEDEKGLEYEAVFISERNGLSGGWRAFALDHRLDDGDALVFELVEPTRFKVYIVRASDTVTVAEEEEEKEGCEAEVAAEKATKPRKKKDLEITNEDDCKVTSVLRRSSRLK